MNIVECYDLQAIIRELETALQIDGSDFEVRDTDIIINNIKNRIGRQYQIDLAGKQIDSEELAIGPYRNALSIFIDNIARIHGKLCGYCQIARYLNTLQISVSDINYLGFTQESLKAALIFLQRKKTQPAAEDAISAIKEKLGTINICWEKRLFILLVVSYDLGFKEITSAIAEILYLSIVR